MRKQSKHSNRQKLTASNDKNLTKKCMHAHLLEVSS